MRDAAKNCNFGQNEDNEAAEQIVQRFHKSLYNFKTTYFAKETLRLAEVINAGRAAENKNNQIQLIDDNNNKASSSSAEVDNISSQTHQQEEKAALITNTSKTAPPKASNVTNAASLTTSPKYADRHKAKQDDQTRT